MVVNESESCKSGGLGLLMRFFRNSVVIFFLGVIASSIIFEAIFAVFEKGVRGDGARG